MFVRSFKYPYFLICCIYLHLATTFACGQVVESACSEQNAVNCFIPPTLRFLSKHPIAEIQDKLKEEVESISVDWKLFHTLIQNETAEFIGYHGGCSDYYLFQDLIRLVVEEILSIPIRSDFHFLRVPGMNELKFNTAEKFLMALEEPIDDIKSHIQQHLLSLNIALFQSYDFPLDLTPRYYIENSTSTKPDYWSLLLEFVEKAGINPNHFKPLIVLGRAYLPLHRGMLLQFFAPANQPVKYSFADTHFYAAESGGKAYGSHPPSYYLINPSITDFPQLRLVINDQDVLNPFISLHMLRYTLWNEEEYKDYKSLLKSVIRSLPVNSHQQKSFRHHLLSLWNK